MSAAASGKRPIRKWRPEQLGDAKRFDKELKKLKPADGPVALLELVEEWRNASDEGVQDMYDREAIAPVKGKGASDLCEFRTSIGNKQFRIIAAQSGGVMHLLHAFSKTSGTDSDHGIDAAKARWKMWKL